MEQNDVNNKINFSLITTIANKEKIETSNTSKTTENLLEGSKVEDYNKITFTNNLSSGTNKNSFWRKTNDRALPGRISLKRELLKAYQNQNTNSEALEAAFSEKGRAMVSTFRDYQQSVSDAWDTGDDEFCIISKEHLDPRISKKMSQTVALNVIATHRITNKTSRSQSNNFSSTSSSNLSPAEDQPKDMLHNQNEDSSDSKIDNNQNRPNLKTIHGYPGRPQLQKLSTNSQDSEYETKIEKFEALLESPLLDLASLKKLSWSGVPKKMRAISWRLLSKYIPPAEERRNVALESKRQGYQDLRHNYFKVEGQDENIQDTYRQIHIDVPRMNPQIALFQQKLVQEMFERILFIWAIRHPASGYVQGINDLVTPFFIVFLQEALPKGVDLEKFDVSSLPTETRDRIEADSFWCLSKFLDCIQDNYIFAQLGIQEKVNQLKDLIQRIDGNLHKHLQSHGVDYLQFSFRWMNNLLTRELPLHCTIRLWDTYLAESDGFAIFHLYVCAAFLLHWKEQLMQQNDFQGLLLLLQNLPTHNWTDRQINVLVAEAFRLKFTYADTPKHLEIKS